MRVWTKSACVVLAWGVLLTLLVAGMSGSVSGAQASIRMASSTTEVTQHVTAAFPTAAKPATAAARYVVQPGDTLSGIAAALDVRGGWQALYETNRPVIGADPDVIHPGTVLVLPGRTTPARYTIQAGDSLSQIAAMLGVRGGCARHCTRLTGRSSVLTRMPFIRARSWCCPGTPGAPAGR